MSIIVLTGPAGAGKNTIANELIKKLDNLVIIDVDTVRQMLVKPHKAPWDGDEGRAQQILGVNNTIALTKNFVGKNYNILILDVLTNETLGICKKELLGKNFKIIKLLPTFEEIQKRNQERIRYLKDEEIEMIYGVQRSLQGADLVIDNTDLSPESVAEKLKELI